MIPAQLHLTKRKVKTIVSLSLAIALTFPPLLNIFVGKSHAANLTSAKVQIGDSRAGVTTNHRFQFVTPSTTSIATILFQYCTTAIGTCTSPSGMVLTAVPTVAGVAGIGGTGYAAAGSSATCTGTGNTNCAITLTVGTPAAQGAGATVIVPVTAGITNPTTADSTYFVRVTTRDNGTATIDGPTTVAFAILTSTSLAVTATVDSNFTFTVTGVATGGIVNGAATTVNAAANTIPFGTLSAGTPSIAAHDLSVTTNAGGGYTVTASHSATALAGFPPLISGINNVDSFSGTNVAPTLWSEPAGSVENTNTGYFGYTTNDASLCTGTAARFTDTGNEWAGTTTAGAEVACAASGVVADLVRVGWQVEVNNVQPSGTYAGTAILVATPTY